MTVWLSEYILMSWINEIETNNHEAASIPAVSFTWNYL